MTTIKKLTCLSTLFIALILFTSTSFAHGNTEPQHGGEVKIVGEYSFELVRDNNQTQLFVAYDGDPINAAQSKALLKIETSEKKYKAKMQAGDNNRFYLENDDLSNASKVLAIVTLADGYSKIVAKYTF